MYFKTQSKRILLTNYSMNIQKPFILQIAFFSVFLLVFCPRNYLLHSDRFLQKSFPLKTISHYSLIMYNQWIVFLLIRKKGLSMNSKIFNWARHLSGWKSVPKGHYLVTNSSSLDQLLEKLGRVYRIQFH